MIFLQIPEGSGEGKLTMGEDQPGLIIKTVVDPVTNIKYIGEWLGDKKHGKG